MFRILCLLTLLISAASGTLAQSNKPWKMPGTKKVNEDKAVARYKWSAPSTACSLLADIPGMRAGDYKSNPALPKQYFCFSPYKPIGSGWSLENNLAYYAIGDHDTATELKLVLNVNLDAAKVGGTVLSVAGDLLTKRALGSRLSDEVLQAMLLGQTGKWDAGENQILLVREDWQNGRGYELRFIIK
jgi:hypothetical protein